MNPFARCVLFPIDLRYGWDIAHVEHQKLLLEIEAAFNPVITTFEFICKYWSKAGSSRAPEKTAQLRAEELPM